MKRKIVSAVTVALAAAMAVSATWVGGASATASGRTIRIDSVVTQENFIDVAPTGLSLGDELVVHDQWKNVKGQVVGHDGIT